MDQSRRAFGRLAVGSAITMGASATFLAREGQGATKIPTTVAGVLVGTCMYCYRDLPRTTSPGYASKILTQAAASGAGLLEINAVYLEPPSDLPPSGIPRIQDEIAPLRPGQSTPKWLSLSPAELAKQREALRQWRANTPMRVFTDFRNQA